MRFQIIFTIGENVVEEPSVHELCSKAYLQAQTYGKDWCYIGDTSKNWK
jgi:hypothetical protein